MELSISWMDLPINGQRKTPKASANARHERCDCFHVASRLARDVRVGPPRLGGVVHR